jgi:hypothetical protein
VSPVTVLIKDCLVLALSNATSNASPGDVGVFAPKVVFLSVNCRYFAPSGIMKDWEKLLLKGESSVRTASLLRMVAAPRVDQPNSGLVVSLSLKFPLVMSARSMALSGAFS